MAKRSAPEVLTFNKAMSEARAGQSKVHLLMGNGFSIACRPDRFRYERLLDQADFSGLSVDAKRLFEHFDTANFEQIIQTLNAAARLVRLYRNISSRLATELEADAKRLKDALAKVLAKTHPEMPSALDEEEYEHAAAFLSKFDCLYTVNYDLLLYWTIMWSLEHGVGSSRDDGFRTSPDDPDADYVIWQAFGDAGGQNVHYLHGGLHLFDAGFELRKFTWVRSGVRLITQIRDALDDDIYPVVVTEGTSDEKLRKIMHNGYLSRGLRSLGALQQGSALFVFGLSFAPNDQHIFDVLARSRLGHLYVGLHGDANNAANQVIITRTEEMAAQRSVRRPLLVTFYDSASAHVWS
jgi:hypothetical protein